MNSEVFEALALLEKERGISVDFMVDRIKKAILTACKNSYNNEDAVINMDPESGKFEVFLRKTVVEEVTDKGREISLEKAREIDPGAEVGGMVSIPLNTKEFGRIAAQKIIREDFRVTKEHGVFYERKGCYLMGTYHPAALLRNPAQKADALSDFVALREKISEVFGGTTDNGLYSV